MRWAVALGLGLAAAAACSKAEDQPPAGAARPPAFTAEEKVRNTDACKAYVEQVCACATAHPDKPEVVDACKYDKALPDALALSVTTAENPASNPTDVAASQRQARKIATTCIEQIARLPALGCP
jgi:hypothetical protein